MKYKDIKSLDKDELKTRIVESRAELFNLKMKHSMGQLGNPLEIRKVRKVTARLLTGQNDKSSAGGASDGN